MKVTVVALAHNETENLPKLKVFDLTGELSGELGTDRT